MSIGRLICLASLVACGRVGFDALPDGAGSASGTDALATRDGPPAAITWIGSFVQLGEPTTTFQFTPHGAGNALVLHVECNNPTAVTVSVSSPTMTWVPLGPVFGSTTTILWAASFGGIATGEVDEFANTDPTGGDVTFDNHAEAQADTGPCTASTVTRHADDAVWAGCTAAGSTDISGVSPGYMKGGDDGDGDWSGYKLSDDPAGTTETPIFNGADGYVMTVVTIKPRG